MLWSNKKEKQQRFEQLVERYTGEIFQGCILHKREENGTDRFLFANEKEVVDAAKRLAAAVMESVK